MLLKDPQWDLGFTDEVACDMSKSGTDLVVVEAILGKVKKYDASQ